MIDKAIAKITDEMMKSKNPAIRHIEEHLTALCTSEAIAEKLLAEGKTLQGAYEAMKKEARRMAGGAGEICISDEERKKKMVQAIMTVPDSMRGGL